MTFKSMSFESEKYSEIIPAASSYEMYGTIFNSFPNGIAIKNTKIDKKTNIKKKNNTVFTAGGMNAKDSIIKTVNNETAATTTNNNTPTTILLE